MKYPNFTQNEYVDQNILNVATGLTSGAIAALASGISQAGLIRPDVIQLAFSGLAASATLALPFAVLFSSGTLASAHGVVTAADTQVYPVNFTTLVPASGSVTAYMVAALGLIQQDPYTIIGPPIGHPDYNPNFQPYTAYNTNVDTLAISATTTVPDNVTTFELARFSLAAGATGLSPSYAYQRRATSPLASQVIPVSGIYNVSVTDAGRTHQFTVSGSAVLPLASGANGTIFPFANACPDAVTIQVIGGGLVYGSYLTGTSGITSITMQPGDACIIAGEFGRWQMLGGTAGPLGLDMLLPAGMGPLPWSGGAAPTGWLLAYGQAVSRVTYSRLNAVYQSAGYPYGSGDGVSTFNVPDCRGRVPAGIDNMGGVAAGRLTGASTGGVNASGLGVVGGEQSHLLNTTEMPAHAHGYIDPTHVHGPGPGSLSPYDGFLGVGGSATSTYQGYVSGPLTLIGDIMYSTDARGVGIAITNTGGGTTHNNVQPTLSVNMIVKT